VEVTINGETRTLPEGETASGLIETLGLTGGRLALEVNGDIVPGSMYPTYRFEPRDQIEIVHAVGGG